VQPESKICLLGTTVSLCVKAAGEAPLHFSWLHDGSVVDGAEDPVLTLKGVGLADVGQYQCHVENKFGKVASLPAKLQLGKCQLIVFVCGWMPAYGRGDYVASGNLFIAN